MTDKRLVSENKKVSVSDISHFNDSDLSKVISEDKRTELFNILHSNHPDHYSRLWLVGFLRYVGYTLEQICSIIESESSWEDYDSKATWLHVNSVFRSSNRINSISLQLFRKSGEKPFSQKGFVAVSGKDKHPCTVKFTECKNCPDLSTCRGLI